MRAPMGALVVVVALWSWVMDREAAPLRKAAAEKLDTADYLKLDKVRAAKVHARGMAVLVAAAGPSCSCSSWCARCCARAGGSRTTPRRVTCCPGGPSWSCGRSSSGVLGKVGTPADKRVTDVATVNAAGRRRG